MATVYNWREDAEHTTNLACEDDLAAKSEAASWQRTGTNAYLRQSTCSQLEA